MPRASKPAAPKTKAKAKTKAKTKAKAKTVTKAKATPKAKTKAKSTAKSTAKAKAKTQAKSPAKTRTKAKAKTQSRTSASKTKARPAARAATGKPGAGQQFKDFEPYQAKRGEEYMNEAQSDHFRAILMNWKRELMQEVDRTVSHMKDEAANFPDPADRATQEEEFSLELRTRDRERKLIKKIDATLELIDQQDYGYCEACGVEIGIQRLEARPTATLCIDCKTLAEIKEKQELG